MKKHIKDIIIIVVTVICIGLLGKMYLMNEELEHKEACYEWLDELCDEYHGKADANLENFHWACEERNKYRELYEKEAELNDELKKDAKTTAELVKYLVITTDNFAEYTIQTSGNETFEWLVNKSVKEAKN